MLRRPTVPEDAAKRAAWRNTAAERISGLTPRERDVMGLVVQGRPNKIIADDLGISQRTVESHRAAVMKRTGVKSLPDLVDRKSTRLNSSHTS